MEYVNKEDDRYLKKARSVSMVEMGNLRTHRLTVENIGPIGRADVEIRPFTVLIGKNNVGKSYLAMLVYGLYGTRGSSLGHFLRSEIVSYELFRRYTRHPPLRRRVGEDTSKLRDEIKNRLTQLLSVEQFKKEHLHTIRSSIEYSFGTRINELLKYGEDKGKITLEAPALKADLELNKQGEVKGNVDFNIDFLVDRLFKSKEPDWLLEAIMQPLKRPAYYLPAARSGILQGYRAIVGAIIRQIPRIPITGIELPKLSGVVADFISTIIEETTGESYRRRGRVGPGEPQTMELVKYMEKYILEGSIETRSESKETPPELFFKEKDLLMPLSRASSMVAELAPLYLYLKYVVSKGVLLIIEEPEAHLHPERQVLLARLLAKMVNSGYRLLITTHSQELLTELSNLILLHKKQSIASELGVERDEILSKDDVAVYHLYTTPSGSESRVLKIDEDGIPLEEMDKVKADLYGKYTKIRYA
jgi:predicted ATPase